MDQTGLVRSCLLCDPWLGSRLPGAPRSLEWSDRSCALGLTGGGFFFLMARFRHPGGGVSLQTRATRRHPQASSAKGWMNTSDIPSLCQPPVPTVLCIFILSRTRLCCRTPHTHALLSILRFLLSTPSPIYRIPLMRPSVTKNNHTPIAPWACWMWMGT